MKWAGWASILFAVLVATLDFWADPTWLFAFFSRSPLVLLSVFMVAPLFPLHSALVLLAAVGLTLVAHRRAARKAVGLLLFIAATCICYDTVSGFGGLAGGGHGGPSSADIERSRLLLIISIGAFLGAVAVAGYSRVAHRTSRREDDGASLASGRR